MDTAAALFGRTDRELWLVTAAASTSRGGLIATFVNQASIVPELPRVLAGIARQHHTWQLIEASGAFALHLLGEANLEWVWQFGLQSGRHVDKLAQCQWTPGKTGSPIVAGALGWLDCRVEAGLNTGDRTIYLAEVVEAGAGILGAALTARRLLQIAPADRKERLRESMERDIAIDNQAIRAWRTARTG